MASSSSTCSVARLVLQQCLSARLQVLPPANGLPAQFVEIGKGLVVYICFMKSATLNDVGKIAHAALNTRLSEETEDGKRTSILDLPGDILIVPQATLGGRLKGKVMQYHGNVGKDLGQELYSNFVTLCKQAVESNDRSTEAGCVVLSGTYGNRQVLSLDTNGPYSHIIEFA